MITLGIDIGGRQHVVAGCGEGRTKADRELLRISDDRAGFDRLDAWLAGRDEPVGSVTMESSGHSWMCLASHLGQQGVAVALVHPLRAKYSAKSRLGRTKSDPADARSLAVMAMRDQPAARDPLEGVELRQAARFAMTLVTEQARVCQRLVRLTELASPSSASSSTILPVAPRARCSASRPPRQSLDDARAPSPRPTLVPGTAASGRRESSVSRPRPGHPSRYRSSTTRSPSRSACCSTRTTCSRTRSPRPRTTWRWCSTVSWPGASRRSRAWALRPVPRSSPRSGHLALR